MRKRKIIILSELVSLLYRKSRISLLTFSLFLMLAGTALLSLINAADKGLVLYGTMKLIFWLIFALLISQINKRWLMGFFLISALIEVVIGIIQFFLQRSIGLWWLGESFLKIGQSSVALTFLNPGLLIRAYGTLPHPNILAALLIIGLLAAYYFWFKIGDQLEIKRSFINLFLLLLLVIVIFLLWLGLLLTFARAGWLIALLVVGWLFFKAYIFGFSKKRIIYMATVTLATILFLIVIFNWAVAPRWLALNYENFTVQERLNDYQRSVEIISKYPLFGQGLKLRFDSQPIHNLYLIIASEIGLAGLLVFLLIIGRLLWQSSDQWDRQTAAIMLIALLCYGLSDHFLWTLRPGIGMFWLVAGMLLI